jgi:hypothetical protein
VIALKDVIAVPCIVILDTTQSELTAWKQAHLPPVAAAPEVTTVGALYIPKDNCKSLFAA